MDNIRKFILNNGNIFWFNNKQLLVNGKNELEAQLKMQSLLPQFIEKDLAFIKILISEHKSLLSNSRVGIYCFILHVDNNRKIYKRLGEKRGKIIWLSDDDIQKEKFDFDLIRKVVKNIYDNKIDMNPFKLSTI